MSKKQRFEEVPKKYPNVQDFLETINHGNDRLLNDEQIFNLTSIKHKDSNLVSFDENAFLYDLIGFLMKNPSNIDSIIEEIISVSNSNPNTEVNSLLFKTKFFVNEAKIYYTELENARNDKIDIRKGLLACPKCKSNKTITAEKQTRSADEGSTLFNSCTKCGNKWKVYN